jgi:hypothetical protein
VPVARFEAQFVRSLPAEMHAHLHDNDHGSIGNRRPELFLGLACHTFQINTPFIWDTVCPVILYMNILIYFSPL